MLIVQILENLEGKRTGHNPPGITTIAILTYPMQSFSMHITYKTGIT